MKKQSAAIVATIALLGCGGPTRGKNGHDDGQAKALKQPVEILVSKESVSQAVRKRLSQVIYEPGLSKVTFVETDREMNRRLAKSQALAVVITGDGIGTEQALRYTSYRNGKVATIKRLVFHDSTGVDAAAAVTEVVASDWFPGNAVLRLNMGCRDPGCRISGHMRLEGSHCLKNWTDLSTVKWPVDCVVKKGRYTWILQLKAERFKIAIDAQRSISCSRSFPPPEDGTVRREWSNCPPRQR